jgi:EAL domain-containing protein (putative c-di-GMP-specific phosphodiesterase class I)
MLARLEETLAQPVDIEGRLMRVQAGIGIATALPGSGTTAVELIRDADVALSYAKNRGKGHSVVFEPRMHDHTKERTELSADLVSAIDAGELSVLYQPLVDLATGTLHGVEALLRWDHPVRGSVSPAVFVPLAEATGQITRIGRWVLGEACRQLAAWQQGFPDAYPLAMEVNIAPEQLADRDLVADVLTTVQNSGIDASALVLEITESALVRDIDTAMARLGQLSAMGLRLALDDFGTGYSSLSYLLRLPVTILKIDKSFLGDASAEGRSLLRGIVDLGSGQGMQMIAEGIENADQAEFVRRSGCHLGQGHYWAPAVAAEQITEIIRNGGRVTPGPAAAPVPAQRTPASGHFRRDTPGVAHQN